MTDGREKRVRGVQGEDLVRGGYEWKKIGRKERRDDMGKYKKEK